MSENYRLVALGREDFVFPFGMTGVDYSSVKNLNEAIEVIQKYDTEKTIFVVDEDIIDDIGRIEELETSGVVISILKGWGMSNMADNKIRRASIKAIGVDMAKEKL